MCGIVALISPAVPITDALLLAMRERLRHRGPDAAGLWVDGSRRIGLAHRRLSMVDLDARSDQPMFSADRRFVLVFNGEIYNYQQLRGELASEGVRFETESDTEVLLVALQQWGTAALARLNGMFAFALWDACERTLLVARDRFGEKPLFLARGKVGTLAFASEIKALLAHPLMPSSTNETALARYAVGRWLEDDGETLFEDVWRLPPAHAALYADDGSELKRWRYWVPSWDEYDGEMTAKTAVQKFREILEDSVRARIPQEVKWGVALSGGIDSSVLTGLADKRRNPEYKCLESFSALFPQDPEISEHNEVERCARHVGVRVRSVEPTPNLLQEESARLHWHQEEPFLSASIYLQWCVARLAREAGVKTLIEGQGADELLGGYLFYFRQRQLDLLDLGHVDRAVRETNRLWTRLEQTRTRNGWGDRRVQNRLVYSPEELVHLVKSKQPLSPSPYTVGVVPTRPGARFRRTLSEALLYNSLPMLLRYSDRNGMAHSIESRLPYLDYELVDFALRLPDDLLVRRGWLKWILRAAGASAAPKEILWRADKVGYAAPLDRWLRGELMQWGWERATDSSLQGVPGYDRKEIEALWAQHQREEADHSWALWRWISLAEWLHLGVSGWWRSGVRLAA